MKTEVFDFKENCIDLDVFSEASKYIKTGGLVAIPTETVYGLAADGLNPAAIRRIFEVKNRPMDNPLILHVGKIEDVYILAKDIKEEDIKILEKLWPGPLTVVLKKKDIVPIEVSAGLDTVAIRIPQNEITRKFIEICETPLAAPSANTSSKPSPTNVKDTLEDMNGKIEAIIDGGECNIGIESTVLDLTSDTPTILRPGFYTKEDLEKYWDRVDLELSLKKDGEIPKSPGQKYKHYAPDADVLILIGDEYNFRKEVTKIINEKSDKKIGLMVFDEDGKFEVSDTLYMGSSSDLSEMGRRIFKSFRDLDKRKVDLIVVHGVESEGYGLSIMNRLKKSASGNIKYLGGN